MWVNSAEHSVSKIFSLKTLVQGLPRALNWSLVRGGTRTYDIGAQFPDRSGWSLESDTPPEFSISNVGVVTAVLPLLHSTIPGNLIVHSDDDVIILPTTIRDSFPADFRMPDQFYSVARSFDGKSGRPLFESQILNADQSIHSETIVKSGGDGYADLSFFDDAPNNTFFVANDLYNQRSTGLTVELALASENTQPIFGYKQNNTNTFIETENGKLAIIGGWNVADYVSSASSFSFIGHGSSNYNTSDTVHYSSPFAMYIVARSIDMSTNKSLVFSDENTYPAMLNSGRFRYSFNTTNNPAAIDLPNANETTRFIFFGERRYYTSNLERPRNSIYLMTQNFQNQRNVTSFRIHNGSGITIILNRYEYSESAIFELESTESDSEMWVDAKMKIVDNAIGVYSYKNQNYTIS